MNLKHLFFLTLFFASAISIGQNITLPPSGGNQKCIVTQYIGSIAHVTVEYNSPDVTAPNGEDRTGKIWGQLVPYGMTDLGFGLRNPSPWRVGSNENTTIEFSHDVKINGQPLAAGKYGLHLIVEETGPWTWIFSRNSTAWGSYFYDEADDALRVNGDVEDAAFHEWLTFEFTDRQSDHATLAMFWENKTVSMDISVPDINQLYLTQIRNELENSAGFNHLSWVAAVNFCIQNNTNLEEALTWAEYAISGSFVGVRDFTTLQTKAGVLLRLDHNDEAMNLIREAIDHPTANASQIHSMGRQMISMGLKNEALEIFKLNHKKFDGAWPTNVGMARGLSATGQFEEALKYAQMAYDEAPDELNKNSMKQAIESLKNKRDIN